MAGVHTFYSNKGFQDGLGKKPMQLYKIPVDCRFVYREAFLQARALPATSRKPGLFLRFMLWVGRKLGLIGGI